ncbi:hypothetical protein [Candidatus Uabimicrobium sp. HlEnr_7]|uniref:hypothetical protein n=1 Tax=Candidatus Uabimicrobium helgolandensis TaxID=3095367 RepID=UPI003558A1BB
MNIIDIVLFFAIYFCSMSLALRIMQHRLQWKNLLFMSVVLTCVPLVSKSLVTFIDKIELIRNPMQFLVALLSIIVFAVLTKKIIKCSAKENAQLTICWFFVFFLMQLMARYAI